MPRRKSSIKATRAGKKKRERNTKVKKELRDVMKKFQLFLTEKKSEEAKQLLPKVFSKLDKAAKKGIIHKNLACRKKSRLSLKVLPKT
ncbi:MAG: 30S ribosomal protein S20 [Candidatus Omnitrophica bacterium]|nr:30S ribosomal protein S20 [Candidatus Omnitrophota bacterium]